jgi:hypothetical protein
MARTLRFTGWSLLTIVALSFTYTAIVKAQGAAAEAKPKYAIKEVMKGAHVPAKEGEKSLRDIVLGGKSTPEQKQQLLDFYISLAENEPPKGDKEAWAKKTSAVVLGAAMIVVGRENGADVLKKATVCAACHKDHKPPAK